jgi:Transposase DDE domain group 1
VCGRSKEETNQRFEAGISVLAPTADGGDQALDERFDSLQFRNPIMPGATVSGFVLTNLDEGVKVVDVDLIARGDARSFTFVTPQWQVRSAGYSSRSNAIRLPANQVLQRRIGHLLTRPVGRRPKKPVVTFTSFCYQAKGWTRARRVVAKVEWHQGELYPRIGYIVTNLTRPNKRVVKFYNGRGTAEQHIKEGKNAIRWTRLSCHAFRHNAVRLQLHALAYNFANFMRTLALPEQVEHWSLTTLREKLVKIGARIVRHGRYVVFQLAEVALPRSLFAEILRRIDHLRPRPPRLPA